jgi:hypothetical protein
LERDRLIHPYAGTLERPRPLLTLHAPHPYAATIEVTALQLAGYRSTQFEVATHWLGPPLPGTPPSDRPVHGNDALVVDELELARAIANRARNSLARGEIPDLWTLSGQVRRRAE